MSVGSFCLILHGHLPYVLRHGTWPHGEDWLYEAAAETYLPLLATLRECYALGATPRMTIGLTPILLEQLGHEDFRSGFERYMKDRIDRARSDAAEFTRRGDKHFAWLADEWERFYNTQMGSFESIDRDIPGAYAACAGQGWVEILSSSATHAYLPLLYEDASVAAQLRAGLASSERFLGFRPRGVWLPECAYRPTGPWHAPIPWGDPRNRAGTDHFVAREGLTHFFVEHQLVEHSRSEWVNNDGWQKVDWEEAAKYPDRGWRSVHEPVRVANGEADPGRVSAFARDPHICERVWSGDIGYPADGTYLEFHKKQGERRGLRYWKITGHKLGLGAKDPYYPDDVAGKIHEHARHFCDAVRHRLHDYASRTGRHGVVAACFDAELFGHWWFEGPRFLRDVILTLNADSEVDLATAESFLESHAPDKAVWMPEGSWGDGGDHRVWVNERVSWIWDIEYRCEATFGKLIRNLPWRERTDVCDLLVKAARELLLLQASDWPFVISREQAVDYGIKRFMQHAGRFESLADIVVKLAGDSEYLNQLSEVERFEIEDADIHDIVFPEIDLNWWTV